MSLFKIRFIINDKLVDNEITKIVKNIVFGFNEVLNSNYHFYPITFVTEYRKNEQIEMPKSYNQYKYFGFSRVFSQEIDGFEVFQKIVKEILKKLKDSIIEIDYDEFSLFIDEAVSPIYYNHSFETFLEAVVHERWSFDIINDENKKNMLKEYLKSEGFLQDDNSIFIVSEGGNKTNELYNFIKNMFKNEN